MRSNLDFSKLRNCLLGIGTKFSTKVATLSGTTSLDATGEPKILFLDPGGAGRTLNLPAESEGDFYIIVNTADAAENLTIKEDSSTTTILVTGQNEIGFLFCNGTTWFGVTGVA